MRVRENKMAKKLRAGEVVVSTKTNLADPRVVDLIGLCGIECIWLDLEHVPNDWQVIENQIRAAKVHGMETLVRVTRGSYSELIKPFEADASAIMVPHLMSAADARQVARITRFHPIGRRPVDGGNADGAYCMIDFARYLQQSNEQKLVMVQIEDPEPLDELDEIAAVDGLDVLFFGPGDFSHAIGAAGQPDHPLIGKARQRVADAALAHGKIAGTVGTLENLAALIDMGYRFINIGADVLCLTEYFSRIAAGVKKIVKQ
ncbi:MAG TPA: aldolase/citrate lyase family protein [bacterium]|nr:aldolase/citrate lyase family protein [bacterium]HNT65886.1 aldolase/citrate lyase family protein [bacterium]HOX86634.1 aldolase/citrate lyase family protein [bacterium]HPG46175.1 aldolase/citrate lyase family protein [bacterium]HPM98196.1 aldolase/citrate lyase family protein [bacterium]